MAASVLAARYSDPQYVVLILQGVDDEEGWSVLTKDAERILDYVQRHAKVRNKLEAEDAVRRIASIVHRMPDGGEAVLSGGVVGPLRRHPAACSFLQARWVRVCRAIHISVRAFLKNVWSRSSRETVHPRAKLWLLRSIYYHQSEKTTRRVLRARGVDTSQLDGTMLVGLKEVREKGGIILLIGSWGVRSVWLPAPVSRMITFYGYGGTCPWNALRHLGVPVPRQKSAEDWERSQGLVESWLSLQALAR